MHAWPFIVLYMVFIFIAWEKSSSITTYQVYNHNSSQTTQQPSATAIIQGIIEIIYLILLGRMWRGMGDRGGGLYLHSCLKIIMPDENIIIML